MANGKSSVSKLSKCIKACNGDAACMKACEDAFAQDGGGTVVSVAEGGKVFTDANGGKVFVTNGGKVF